MLNKRRINHLLLSILTLTIMITISIDNKYFSYDKGNPYLKVTGSVYVCLCVCTKGPRKLLNRYGFPLQCTFS